MEILNNNTENGGSGKTALARNIYLGTALIVAGILWLLYNFGYINSSVIDVIFSWQMLLIVLGGYLMSLGRWTGGFIMIFLGIAFAVARWAHFCIPVSKIILPAVVIAAGILVLFNKKS